MSGQWTLARSLRRTGLTGFAVLAVMAARPATAEVYSFSSDEGLDESMTALVEALGYDAAPPDPCRLDILNDLRGHDLFDDQTTESMQQALAAALFGANGTAGCTVENHRIDQSEIGGFLLEKNQSGDLGLSLALSYYKLGEGLTVFATLRDESGGILGSTGRFDLAVEAEERAANVDQAGAGEADQPAPEEEEVAVVETEQPSAAEPPAEPTPVTGETALEGTELFETSLRRQLADEARIRQPSERAFNLRRIQSGTPPWIKTIKILDAGGLDTALIEDLAESFSSASDGAIEVQPVDNRTAFTQIFDNDADLLVTREPISEDDAENFRTTYGVNMRSRYAEHVLAIAAGDDRSVACNITYPQSAMLMSTEEHPTSERIYVYVNPSIPSAVRDQFVEFILSDEGQTVVAEHAIDLRLQLGEESYAAWRDQLAGERPSEQPDMLERFRKLISRSQRVSSTFRFEFASADLVLDSRSEQDLENLIDLVKATGIDSRRIYLFGFADSAGAAIYNADLSNNRADAVATRLRLAGIPIPPRNVYGIGEDSPIACDTLSNGNRDEQGAYRNRRVEVWIEN